MIKLKPVKKLAKTILLVEAKKKLIETFSRREILL